MRLALLLAIVVLIGALAMLYLKSRALELVHSVLINAVIQKAPPDYPEFAIRSAFESRLRECETEAERNDYLNQLKALSQRLEKMQSLKAGEVDEILEDVAVGEAGKPANDVLR